MYEFIVGQSEQGMRLDQYLARRLPDILSRTLIQRVIRAGGVTVNEKAAKANLKLRNSDRIIGTFDALPPRPVDAELVPERIPLDIAYEDDFLLIVNKPAGLVTHPAPGHWSGTLVNAVLWHLGYRKGTDTRADGEPLPRAGIVHRLDKDTSGLLLIAKTPQAHLILSRQLKARTMHRAYVAVVEGQPPFDTGTVDAAVGRHLVHRKRMTIQYLGGRHAVTHYRVLKRTALVASSAERGKKVDAAVMELMLDTGRTHQIRVHMAHVGYPVVGDTVYGRHTDTFWQSFGIERQLLHAYRLSFRHPDTHLPLTVKGKIPEDVARIAGADVVARLDEQLSPSQGRSPKL